MLNNLRKQHPDVVFLAVYIREAHASDEWPLGTMCSRPQHKSIEDRLAAAREFQEKFKFEVPLVVDSMSDQFESVFAVWPERYFCVKNGVLDYIACPSTEYGFNRQEIVNWLDATNLPSPRLSMARS